MTRSKHARPITTGRKLAAGALSVPMALTMAGTAAATEPVAADASVTSEAAISASATDELLAHDALEAKPAALPERAAKGQDAKTEPAVDVDAEVQVEEAPADEDEAVVPAAKKPTRDERPATSNSAAAVTLDVDCTTGGATVTVESDKDISNVKVYYADGSMDERSLSGNDFTAFFAGDVVKVSAKSGTTEVVEDGLSCSAGGGQSTPEEPSTPAPGTPINGGGGGAGNGGSNSGSNSEADVDVDVQCTEDGVTVVVGSDKDISNVKVYYADGSMDEIEDLEGYEFEETFTGDVVKVTAKSGTTEVVVLADEFAACEVPDSENPDTPDNETPDTPDDENPDTPDDENPDTPDNETPDNETPGTPGGPIGGGGGGAGTGNPPAVTPPAVTPVGNTPVVNTPVVSTPAVPTTPIVGQPAPAAGVGVVSNPAPQAFVPTRSAGAGSTASPAALPFTGSTTSLLLALGAGLVAAGGALALSGRRASTVASV